MRIMEFGNKANKSLVLIHGLGGNWTNWLPHITTLKSTYRVIVPVLPGHDEASKDDFTSLRQCAEEISDFLIANYEGKVDGVCGLSLGGQVTMEILALGKVSVRKAIIDGSPARPVSKYYARFHLLSIQLIAWLSRKGINIHRYAVKGPLADELFQAWARISTHTVKRAHKEGFNYTLPDSVVKSGADIFYWHGSKEAALLKDGISHIIQTIPGAKIESFAGLNHSEMCMYRPQEYSAKIMAII